MRVSSLIALAVVVATALYFVFLTPQWAVDLYRQATGYGPAKTPTEAQDRFLKAVQARDYNTAATFCTGDFADQLKRAATGASELGKLLDSIADYAHNKGFHTDKGIYYVYKLDPLPPHMKTKNAPKEVDATHAKGYFEFVNPKQEKPVFIPLGELNSVDVTMFRNVLTPINLFDPQGFDIVKEGEVWKLKFPMPAVQVQHIDHFLNNHKAYVSGLRVFRTNVTNERFDSKQAFENELIHTMQKQKV